MRCFEKQDCFKNLARWDRKNHHLSIGGLQLWINVENDDCNILHLRYCLCEDFMTIAFLTSIRENLVSNFWDFTFHYLCLMYQFSKFPSQLKNVFEIKKKVYFSKFV